MSGVEINLEPFSFANFLKVREWSDHTYPVALLSPELAAAYWDELKPLWLAHCAQKKSAYESEMDALIKERHQ